MEIASETLITDVVGGGIEVVRVGVDTVGFPSLPYCNFMRETERCVENSDMAV